MDYALQRCCTTPIFLKQYETSTDATLNKLGVGVINIKEFNCCGYPLKNYNYKAHVLASARNLALAEKRGLDMMTICNCCYGNLKDVNYILREKPSLKNEINAILEKEALSYNGQITIKHLMEIFYTDIGLQRIKEKITRPFRGLKIAIHYGCHILRPKQLVQFENPGTAATFNQLVEITGAETVSWSAQTDCCGSPMLGIDDDLSIQLTHKKIMSAIQSGADYLCVACSYCQLQFDRVQRMSFGSHGNSNRLPSILYTQLLGLSLGLDEDVLGIQKNELDSTGIKEFCL